MALLSYAFLLAVFPFQLCCCACWPRGGGGAAGSGDTSAISRPFRAFFVVAISAPLDTRAASLAGTGLGLVCTAGRLTPSLAPPGLGLVWAALRPPGWAAAAAVAGLGLVCCADLLVPSWALEGLGLVSAALLLPVRVLESEKN